MLRRFAKQSSLVGAALSFTPTTLQHRLPHTRKSLPFVVGNTKGDTIKPASHVDSQTTISDIIGLSTVGTDIVHRLPAGEILGMMDICAARTALKFAFGTEGMPKWGNDVSVATVAADNVNFKFPLLHGDSVEMTGTVVNAGKSSIAVHVETNRLMFPSRQKQLVSESYFFMVVIQKAGEDGIKTKDGLVPPLMIADDKHWHLHRTSVSAREGQKLLAEESKKLKSGDALVPAKLAEVTLAAKRDHHVTFESTKTSANRLFFPGHLNLNKTIFGGEIIRWMEMHAVHCGRLFTKNKNVFTIGMHSCEFRHPILLSDWVSLEAHAVYVHNTTLEIDVEVFIERPDHPIISNKASFVVTNFDEVGMRKEIPVGLDLESASQEWLHRYASAKHRYSVSRHRCMLDPKLALSKVSKQ